MTKHIAEDTPSKGLRRRSAAIIAEDEERIRANLWYILHRQMREDVEAGKVKVVEEGEGGGVYRDDLITRPIWEAAQSAAKRHEERYGFDKEYPYDQRDVWMMFGKLSALRWVLGEDWDFMDL